MERRLHCSDCIHCSYSWCKETEDDFYKIEKNNNACEDFASKNCEMCIWCTRREGKYYCRYDFPPNCHLFEKAERRAGKDPNIWPPRKGFII